MGGKFYKKKLGGNFEKQVNKNRKSKNLKNAEKILKT